ncbi:helix-turn-helix transcriptional regulator [Gilvimarinus agarilyticus]|uniref:helix-turn-helix transcriptional regulator n=1 Tax=Gilvimarinus agarilyticus TaxID=679259 RepID=UPI00059FA16E|nr:AraC family transcriptional regulator [Gilvimarinus agarilyticus]
MTSKAHYEIDSACVQAHEFPAALIDLACSRGVDSHRLLRGTGIFLDDFLRGELTLRPAQCFALLSNIRKILPAAETAFLAGARLYPGNFGPASSALQSSGNLLQALNILVHYQAILSPLLSPRLEWHCDDLYIYWHDACGAGEHVAFLTDMMITALVNTSKTLAGRPLAWQFHLPGEPAHREQYEVHWGRRIHTHSHQYGMQISRSELAHPWPGAAVSVAQIARSQCDRLLQELPNVGFVALFDGYLRDQLADNPSLETAASEFGISPATLKRKLKKHHTSFQQRFDLVRKEQALFWLTREQLPLAEVATRLHFHDARNLRRAFKRWTGIIPSQLTSAITSAR